MIYIRITGAFALLLVSVCAALAQSPVTSASGRWAGWRKQWENQFPTAAWSYFSRYSGTVDEYTVYKNAGLTMVQVPLTQYDNAVSAGLRAVTGGWERLHEDQIKLDNFVAYPEATDPSTTGYNLIDEPHPSDFSNLQTAVSRIYQTDQRKAIPIMTMLPNWAVPETRFGMSYEAFVNMFVQQTNPAVMLSTHYPTLCDGTDRPEYYQNIELFREHALAKDIGLMGFVLLTPHNHRTATALCYRLPSESDIYWQVYSMVAYGAQGVWYYNYRIENNHTTNYNFGEGIVMHSTGQPNPSIYPHVQSVNDQLHKLAHILMKLKSVGVFHVHDEATQVPIGTTRYTNGSIGGVVGLEGDNFLISEFGNQDDSSDQSKYIMLVNKRHNASAASASLQATVTLAIDQEYPYVYHYNPSDGSLNEVIGSDGKYVFNTGGGHGRLIRLSKQPLISSSFGNDLNAILNNGYQLNVRWSTNTEENVSHFEVMTSRYDNDFRTIGRVNSKAINGVSQAPLSYDFNVMLYSMVLSEASVFPLLAVLLSLGLLYKKRKAMYICLATFVLVWTTTSCNKTDGLADQGSTEKIWVQVVKVHKDGSRQHTGIIEVEWR